MLDSARPDPDQMIRAAGLLRGGELIAFPTDTFYGIGADPWNEEALRRITRIKRRPEASPILVLAAGPEQVCLVAASIPSSLERLAGAFWPGPLTLVVPARAELSRILTGGTGTIGIRVPASRIARGLATALARPITGTSANRSGEPAAATAEEVRALLEADLRLLIDGGPAPGLVPSTVVDLSCGRPRLIRAGAVPFERVLEAARLP